MIEFIFCVLFYVIRSLRKIHEIYYYRCTFAANEIKCALSICGRAMHNEFGLNCSIQLLKLQDNEMELNESPR